jgi:hypothetical protein
MRPPTSKTMTINFIYVFQLKLITHGRAGCDGQHFEEISTHDSAMQINSYIQRELICKRQLSADNDQKMTLNWSDIFR